MYSNSDQGYSASVQLNTKCKEVKIYFHPFSER